MAATLSPKQVDKFHKDGFLVVENFCSDEECDSLKDRCYKIIDEVDFATHPIISYSTEKRQHASKDYFLKSGDKIHFFFEEGALNEDGSLKVEPKMGINKLAHGLHACDPVFKEFTHSEKIVSLIKSLGIKKAAVIQGMCIIKPPRIGGVVKPHRDSTFLYTDPMHLYGFWMALEDVTKENGCLWFAPGSQNNPVTRRVMRTSDDPDNITLQTFGELSDVPDSAYVPVEVKKGSMVLIHGMVLHKSAKNESDRSRLIYTFHVYDEALSTYDKRNWLQPTKDHPFQYIV